ncbi:MAG: nuclear transport factor 2 family protein [Pseudazoarcus pumilus]|nr:nuclear transport factor 2 family protein [Pseudazoarcus pumilus]
MEKAMHPEDLARLFIRRANAGDLEGLVALYEADAVVAVGEPVAQGHDEIRRFYAGILEKKREFPPVDQMAPVINGDLAITVSRLPNGNLSAEIARRQRDGSWRWTVDQLKIKPIRPEG